MNPSLSNTYRQYQDSSEQQQHQVPIFQQENLIQEKIIQLMDKEALIELLFSTRKQMRFYMTLQQQTELKLKNMTHLYQQALGKVMSNKNKDRIKYHDQNNSNIGNTLKLKVNSESFTKQQFKKKILKLTHSSSQIQCIQKYSILKQSGKFICSLYKLVDEHTNYSYFKGEYNISSAWNFIKILIQNKQSQQINNHNQILCKLLNCKQKQIVDKVHSQYKQLNNLRNLFQLVQQKDANILSQIYEDTRKSTYQQYNSEQYE